METQHTTEIGTGPVWCRDSSAFSMQLFAANPYAVYPWAFTRGRFAFISPWKWG